MEELIKIPRWALKSEIRVISQQENIQEIKYQDVIYFKNNSDKVISGLEFQSIDFLKAMSEMESMDWNFSPNSIGFSRRGDDAVLFRRKSQTNWSAEVPIFEDEKWTGFGWFSQSDNSTISNLLRLFFEQVPWFGRLSWKMGKKAV